MLKCLELIGFKSFADKTRFDFDAGITAIVGPNGSGKSNVVDSIRWILGEQSAKSLRGSEMADVIFNGAATRRSLGMAEVSLTLDNRNGYLPIESEEVIVTRRVYRSGEGEYLINGQMARLKDIKELFLGTGASTYSIIEQGKVELLLQSSTKDRRQVFEEAAGISRFKAKKIESLRRLDRVEQNLIRIQDIHDEVDKQLRTLRAQAGKAKKYKEYADELQQLRLLLGKADYYQANEELTQLEQTISKYQSSVKQAEQELARDEESHRAVDERLTQLEDSVRQVVQQLSEIARQISSVEAQVEAGYKRDGELAAQTVQLQEQLQASKSRLRTLQAQRIEVAQRLEHDQAQGQQIAKQVAQKQAKLDALAATIASLKETFHAEQQLARNRFQELARFENEQAGLESQLQFQWQQHERFTRKEKELSKLHRQLVCDIQQLMQQEQSVLAQARRFHTHASSLHEKHQAQLARRNRQAADVAATKDRRTAIASQIEVLDSLRQRHEGLAGGVREALERQAAGDETWKPVLGVLAECIQTSAEYADLVELALGSRAEALVLPHKHSLTTELLQEARKLPGRVQFVTLTDDDPERLVVESDDSRYPALSSLVECEDRFRPLIDRLLGSIYVVKDYTEGSALARRSSRTRLVTRDGEVIGPDGFVSAGPKRSASGILSRSAQLRDLQHEIEQVDKVLAEQQANLSTTDQEIVSLEERLSWHEIRQSTLAEQRRHFEATLAKLKQRRESLEAEWQTTRLELARTDDEIKEVDKQYLQVEQKLEKTHEEIKQLTERSKQLEESLEQANQARQELEKEVQAAKVEQAILDERVTSAQAQFAKLEADLHQRGQETRQCLEQIEALRKRRSELQLRLLADTARLAELYYQRSAIANAGGYDPAQIEQLRLQRKELAANVTRLRKQFEQEREKLHHSQLRITELRMNRDTVAERLREDYQIEIATQFGEDYVLPSEEEREQARHKVKELRDKIGKLGSVNVQAVEQLDELELRAGTLKYQIDDLVAAKKHLESVIDKINEESRRLFLDTFETVRQHFQEVFRKLFGGGKADLILEDETDVLETGIEVIARPPGKEPRSISLLSGGEKSLTAVALLMAIFRSRPSPFCILDEVDAALDESNIGRYVGVLREFLDRSQFILVTHSKVTMAAADMLHGVTQRESGVSIRVSVRLEDVTEDGQILDSAQEESVESA